MTLANEGLSICNVLIVPRQIVGAVTALGVLLCSIACACDSMAAPPGGDHHNEQLPAIPSCHGHHSSAPTEPEHGGHSDKPDPCKEKGGDHSCQHCQSTASPQLGDGKSAVQLTPFTHLVGVSELGPVHSLSVSLLSTRWEIAGDLSPPLAPTLLRLHCALNT